MAILLNKHVISFCLGAAAAVSYSRFFKVNSVDSKDECIIEVDGYGAIVRDIVRDIVNTALGRVVGVFYHHQPCVTKEVARLLNIMDRGMKVKARWDVTEDDKALYLIRDISGLDKMDVIQSVKFPSGDNRFVDYRFNVFGYARVYRMKQYPPAILFIEITAGVQSQSTLHRGYTIELNLPGGFYKSWDVSMDVKDEVLKITIPKEKGRWIQEITGDTDYT